MNGNTYFAKFHRSPHNDCFQYMFAGEYFETINDMVHLLHPTRLRLVIIVKKVFIQNPK